ncbi:MAG: ribose-phosphate pyrophosphokinase [Lentisphaerae bacterium]|jgi:ribose-phosphate pyrophosphokinase|nr:ribose-phosphate pyrophosphokinase [Lentisphaerota bacterium]MBT4816447.1 ribose-phosphate pyrophosphokinase [Lentisphaerota bacterium]MBT5606768.1 ribose-phosphate pyrophosphokinase [Lentisphaerota bacterium]MBT7061564.1 ribose-phosphate pyrophosphokinase [Lentisphaerota bacterium]MBT7843885.1 ribose-phosphate pyrophosphokinase [Lentisphaerota bacterium]
MGIRLFSGTANPDLSSRIADELGKPLGKVEISRFPEGEVHVQYTDNIRGADVYIIQPTCAPPNENLMELLILLDAARRASAKQITAVLPFYGYARQDRKDRPRVPISAKLVANLLVTAGAQRVLTMDLHAQQIQGFFDVPVDHLYAAPVLVRYLIEAMDSEVVVVAPDSGGVKMAHAYADMLDCGFALVAKRRIDAERVESSHLVGDVAGRDCVLVDDLTTTAGTLAAAAEKLKENGANRVFAAVSHCCLTDKGFQTLRDSCITELVTTDSVPLDPCRAGDSKLKVLSVAGLLAEAIKRIHKRRSVSSLFRLKSAPDVD